MKKFIIVFIVLLLCALLCVAGANLRNFNEYNKSDTMSFEEYLYADKSKESRKTLKLNDKGDVIYLNKVVLTNEKVPLNKDTAYTDNELKLFFAAAGIEPHENCDVTDTLTNGTLGCYIDNPDE